MSVKGKALVSCLALLAGLLLVACINSKTEDNNDSSDSSSSNAIKQGTSSASTPDNAIKQGSWKSISHSVEGSWYIVQSGTKLQLIFGNDFATINGPDLHLLLSPLEPSAITGSTATQGSTEISAFPGSSGNIEGPITFDLPEGTDLSQYKSIVIQCIRYSATWAVGTL